MAIKFEDWLNSEEVKQLQKIPNKQLIEKEFFRNPLRHIRYDPNLIYSPCDGVILYIGEYNSEDKILEIKGRNYSIQDIFMCNEIKGEFYVVGIFLTFFSVHVVRSPVTGYISNIVDLDPIISSNLSMCLFEAGLFDNKIDKNYLDYNFYNERSIVTIKNNRLQTNFHIVMIADKDVDRILYFRREEDTIMQGDRLAWVTYGSQCDLLIEKKPWFKLKKNISKGYYVYAGLDPLFTVEELKFF